MAGLGLLELHKGYQRGGDRKSNTHDASLIWPEVVKRELGISHDTARRWMDMARAARPRLTKGDIDLGRILEKHPGALTPAEQELLKTAVHKISDGKTQMEFLLECGVACAGSPGAKRAGEAGASATKGRKRAQTRHFLNARAGLVQTRSLAMWDELKDDGTPHFTPAQKTEVLRRLSGALAEWPAELLSAAVAEAKLLLNQKK